MKKILLLSISLILIILVSGCIDGGTVEVNSVVDCADVPTMNCNDPELFLSIDNDRDYCYKSFALENQDASICANIPQARCDSQQTANMDQCYYEVALLVKDASICDNIEDNLKWNVAGYRKNFCKAIILKDTSYCDALGDSGDRDVCIHDIVRTWGDTSFCEEISSDLRRENCLAGNN